MSFCIQCSFVGTVDEVRKHQFHEHYDYFKLQCGEDPQIIKEVMKSQ